MWNTHKENTDQSPQEKRATLPYIHSTSEMTARILLKHILITHKPSNKIATYFTEHKDQVTTADKRNSIYIFNCNDCTQSYIGETSKKVKTRLTEHENAIKRHDPRSIPANHADEQGHSFDISNTKILGHAKSRHAREFLEAWHSIQSSTINRHIDISQKPTSSWSTYTPVNVQNLLSQPLHNRRILLPAHQTPKIQQTNATNWQHLKLSKTAGTNACEQKLPFTSDDDSMNRVERWRPKP